MREGDRKKQSKNMERSKSQTKQQWLTLGRCIGLFSLTAIPTCYFFLSSSLGLCVFSCLCVRFSSWGANTRLWWPCWILNSTSHFLVSSVKIDGKVLKSNALKSDTGRYYPARHSHPWVSFVFVLRTRPVLEARAVWHHATRCSVGGGLFEEPVSEAARPLAGQIPLAKPDP